MMGPEELSSAAGGATPGGACGSACTSACGGDPSDSVQARLWQLAVAQELLQESGLFADYVRSLRPGRASTARGSGPVTLSRFLVVDTLGALGPATAPHPAGTAEAVAQPGGLGASGGRRHLAVRRLSQPAADALLLSLQRPGAAPGGFGLPERAGGGGMDAGGGEVGGSQPGEQHQGWGAALSLLSSHAGGLDGGGASWGAGLGPGSGDGDSDAGTAAAQPRLQAPDAVPSAPCPALHDLPGAASSGGSGEAASPPSAPARPPLAGAPTIPAGAGARRSFGFLGTIPSTLLGGGGGDEVPGDALSPEELEGLDAQLAAAQELLSGAAAADSLAEALPAGKWPRFGNKVVPEPAPSATLLKRAAALLERDDTNTGAPLWRPPGGGPDPQPLAVRFSWVAAALLLAYAASLAYYLWARTTLSLDLGDHAWYGWVVLAVEVLGATAVLPYGAMLVAYTVSTGSAGLPPDIGRVSLPPSKHFAVHVLVPCFKESVATVAATLKGALSADLPPGTTRTVYLCDDGGDPEKELLVEALGPEARYVTGRERAPGEVNGKSANLNHALRTAAFLGLAPADIPAGAVVVVFDADMALEVLWDDSVALCLTPQAFSNADAAADVFNNANAQFWELVLPGCDALGYVACTGTNFAVRAAALAAVGWFPEYTITEDYALSMELKAAGFRGRYLPEYLAVGEAPEEARNIFRQRSRWCKGHMQVFFSRSCPLFRRGLSPLQRWLYTHGTWSYLCNVATVITFGLIPFNSVVFGMHPCVLSTQFAAAATARLVSGQLLTGFASRPGHLLSMWLASVSNSVLAFTVCKAIINTLLSHLGLKGRSGFKATDKKAPAPAVTLLARLRGLGAAAGATLGRAVRGATWHRGGHSNLLARMWGHGGGSDSGSGVLAPMGATATGTLGATIGAAGGSDSGAREAELGATGAARSRLGMATAGAVGAEVEPGRGGTARPPQRHPPPQLRGSALATLGYGDLEAGGSEEEGGGGCGGCAWLKANWETLGGALDPLWLAASLMFSGLAMAAGAYQAARPGGALHAARRGALLQAWAVALLGWSLAEFPRGFAAAGLTSRVEGTLRYGAEHLLACHDAAAGSLVVQIGSPADYALDLPGNRWGGIETLSPDRTAYKITANSPGGADAAASAAAALAAASLALAPSDAAFAARALASASSLLDLAQRLRARSDTPHCAAVACALEQPAGGGAGGATWRGYPSASVDDDLAWGAAWMHRATGDPRHLAAARAALRSHWGREAAWGDASYYAVGYDSGPAFGTALLLARAAAAEGDAELAAEARRPLLLLTRGWMDGENGLANVTQATGRGLWRHFGSEPLHAAAGQALLAALSEGSGHGSTLGLSRRLNRNVLCFAHSQVSYILGGVMGPRRSFIVGYGEASLSRPQHRLASCAAGGGACDIASREPNPHMLTGALVAGPDESDGYADARPDAQSRVSLAANAALLGALAGLAHAGIEAGHCQGGRGLTLALPYAP
ncbi:MAG: glycosyl hydrolase family 9-domain-containing protein [Monoraphidium minutum]|nr:MAG: glycosyl hydrolase family 9-domain-containing protein [Monoraphidium minutum]